MNEPLVVPLAPGLEARLAVRRFGRSGAGPKVYIQGALHADEAPGSLVAHYLCGLLDALPGEAFGGEIVVVPVANPLGLGQRVFGTLLGRFALADGRNFNRYFPDLLAETERRLDSTRNVDVVSARAAAHAALAAWAAPDAGAQLKKALLGLTIDADYVLDLHCDAEAEVHFYAHPAQAEKLQSLFARMGANAVLLAEISGGDPFDEAVSRLWLGLAERYPAVGMRGIATTVELRGQSDTDPDQAAADARAILEFLADCGALALAPPPPPPRCCASTPLAACETPTAPMAGILCFRAPTGAELAPGDVFAELVDATTGTTLTLRTESGGRLFARTRERQVSAGQIVAKIAGRRLHRVGRLLDP